MTMFSDTPSFWADRLKASALHMAFSLCIATLAALLVFAIWYPNPYRDISGGRELFLLLVAVDVILGPLITLAVFNRNKPSRELRRDLAIVAVIQLAALGYGLWTVAVARPVHIVFEYKNFRVVHAIDVPPELLPQTPDGIDALPLAGPTLLGLRPFKDNKERLDATMAALQGLTLSSRPDLWQPYAQSVQEVLKVARPVSELKTRFASEAADVDRALAQAGRTSQNTVYVPLAGRKSFWTVFLDSSTAQVVATMHLDSF
jgi:hypothetical protein